MLKEIQKRTALDAYQKVFNRGYNYVNDNFVKAYKVSKLYVMLVKYDKEIAVLMYGHDKDDNEQMVCLNSEAFKALREIDVEMSEILYKEKDYEKDL